MELEPAGDVLFAGLAVEAPVVDVELLEGAELDELLGAVLGLLFVLELLEVGDDELAGADDDELSLTVDTRLVG